MVMNRGEVVELAGADELYSSPRHPYTRQLLSSMPRGWVDRASGEYLGTSENAVQSER
jgi:oligopeptide/dipeptide ABC transporter ATP-binding protein